MISARMPENECVMMGTGSDSDVEEDEDSDDGSDSEGDCFSKSLTF
jgi:hypothetical protein